MIHIVVNTLNGENLELVLEPDAKVQSLKLAIEAKVSIPVLIQEIVSSTGQVLDDEAVVDQMSYTVVQTFKNIQPILRSSNSKQRRLALKTMALVAKKSITLNA